MKLLLMGVCAILLLGVPVPREARAQSMEVDVVSSCGSLTYTAGYSRHVTMDTTGRTCEQPGPLPAGTAIIGKVGIDQTTPGTTNAVSATNFPTTVSTNAGATGASSLRET